MKVFTSVVAAITLSILVAVTSGKANTGIARPVDPNQWTPEARLWAVRSLIGEVGWGNPKESYKAANEWVSVLSVYATRVQETGWPLVKIIRKYSSAIKSRSTHQRPWLLGINSTCDQPAGWPATLKWSTHQPICEEAFLVADRWANGEIQTLTPDADHYGGPMDHFGDVHMWKQIKTPPYYLNKFYNSRIREHKPITFGRLEL